MLPTRNIANPLGRMALCDRLKGKLIQTVYCRWRAGKLSRAGAFSRGRSLRSDCYPCCAVLALRSCSSLCACLLPAEFPSCCCSCCSCLPERVPPAPCLPPLLWEASFYSACKVGFRPDSAFLGRCPTADRTCGNGLLVLHKHCCFISS